MEKGQKYITIDEVQNGWVVSVEIKHSDKGYKTVHATKQEVIEQVTAVLDS